MHKVHRLTMQILCIELYMFLINLYAVWHGSIMQLYYASACSVLLLSAQRTWWCKWQWIWIPTPTMQWIPTSSTWMASMHVPPGSVFPGCCTLIAIYEMLEILVFTLQSLHLRCSACIHWMPRPKRPRLDFTFEEGHDLKKSMMLMFLTGSSWILVCMWYSLYNSVDDVHLCSFTASTLNWHLNVLLSNCWREC